MKKISILFFASLLLFQASNATGQTFTMQHDTVAYTYTGSATVNILDGVFNTSTVVTDSVTLRWKVLSTDFPSDWQSLSGLCDNNVCYGFFSMWPSSAVKTSSKYPNGLGDFHLQTNLSTAASSGTHYVTARLYNPLNTDSATAVFKISYTPNSVPGITKSLSPVELYPNPAHDEINITYDPNSEVKNVAVYNIIGKTMNVYKITDNSSANLNIENLPAGVYFVKIFNTSGEMVATKKFVKQ